MTRSPVTGTVDAPRSTVCWPISADQERRDGQR